MMRKPKRIYNITVHSKVDRAAIRILHGSPGTAVPAVSAPSCSQIFKIFSVYGIAGSCTIRVTLTELFYISFILLSASAPVPLRAPQQGEILFSKCSGFLCKRAVLSLLGICITCFKFQIKRDRSVRKFYTLQPLLSVSVHLDRNAIRHQLTRYLSQSLVLSQIVSGVKIKRPNCTHTAQRNGGEFHIVAGNCAHAHLISDCLLHLIRLMGRIMPSGAVCFEPTVFSSALVMIHPGIKRRLDLSAIGSTIYRYKDCGSSHARYCRRSFFTGLSHQTHRAGQNLGLFSIDLLCFQFPLISFIRRHPVHIVGVKLGDILLIRKFKAEPEVSSLIRVLLAIYRSLIGKFICQLVKGTDNVVRR